MKTAIRNRVVAKLLRSKKLIAEVIDLDVNEETGKDSLAAYGAVIMALARLGVYEQDERAVAK